MKKYFDEYSCIECFLQSILVHSFKPICLLAITNDVNKVKIEFFCHFFLTKRVKDIYIFYKKKLKQQPERQHRRWRWQMFWVKSDFGTDFLLSLFPRHRSHLGHTFWKDNIFISYNISYLAINFLSNCQITIQFHLGHFL